MTAHSPLAGGTVFPVLEVGGTHVTAALVAGDGPDGGGWNVLRSTVTRASLDAHGTAEAILATLADAAASLGSGHNNTWGVAVPGPFDYEAGIARYRDVGKFDQLRDHDVRASLSGLMTPAPRTLVFLNDADAFGIGEYAIGTAGNHERSVCITLGTGIGSSFLDHGVPVKGGPSVPPDGSAYLLRHGGLPLEDTVSRRAIRAAYAASAGSDAATEPDTVPDVREIAEAARNGNTTAARVLHDAFSAMGQALAGYLDSFNAETLIIGGSIAQSWDLVEPAIRRGIAQARPALGTLPLVRAERAEDAGLIGTAYWAARNSQPATL